MIPCHFKTIVAILQELIFKKIPHPIKICFFSYAIWKIKRVKCRTVSWWKRIFRLNHQWRHRKLKEEASTVIDCALWPPMASKWRLKFFFLQRLLRLLLWRHQSLWRPLLHDGEKLVKTVQFLVNQSDFQTNSKTCQMAVFTFSNAMIWQDLLKVRWSQNVFMKSSIFQNTT